MDPSELVDMDDETLKEKYEHGLQANQPEQVIVEIPARFGIGWQDRQHAVGRFQGCLGQGLAAGAILQRGGLALKASSAWHAAGSASEAGAG